MQENNFYEKTDVSRGESPGDTSTAVKRKKYIRNRLCEEAYIEKKGIKRAANCLAVSFLILLTFFEGWSYIFVAVTDLLGISRRQAALVISDPMIMQGINIFMSLFFFTVPFIIFYKLADFRISDLVILKRPIKGTALPLFLIGISFCSFANIAISYAESVFDIFKDIFGFEYSVNFGQNPTGIYGFLLNCISTVAVPALVEEFACRGLLLGSLKKYGEGFAIFTSAVVFGFMHGNFEQMPFAFLVGLVLGFITVKSGSVWTAVAVHAFNNSVSVFYSYFLNTIPIQIKNITYIFFLCISLFMGFLGLVLLKNRDGGFFKLSNMDTNATEGQKYRWFFLRPLVILVLGLCIYESINYFS